MSIKKRGLGRGLDVLIKSRNVEPDSSAEIVTLDMGALSPNIHQPRHHFDETALQELAASIKAQGLIQPILVRPLAQAGKYEIVAGERRWRACQIAGLAAVECIVRQMDDSESMAIALIENLQREDLNPIEEARALEQIKVHFQITQEELADKIGKSRPAVANTLRLLKLPDTVQRLLETSALSAGHARALLGLDDQEAISMLAKTVLEKGLNVRATEALIKKYKETGGKTTGRKSEVPEISGLLRSLGQAFNVKHSGSAHKGKIVFSYASPAEREQLAAFLERMNREHGQ